MLVEAKIRLEDVKTTNLLYPPGIKLAGPSLRFNILNKTNVGKKGKLARNTATSYHRNVKLWLFDKYPHLRVPTELILLKQGKTLDKYCMKREKGGLINKAPPCTKEDLQSLVRYVYSTARVHADYQDAALACLVWHCFGRSSDLGYIQKQHVSVSADGTFYLQLLRVKTSEEQGFTLIPDKSDFLTCPLHALAVALATQDAPCAALLAQLPDLVAEVVAPLDEGAPLQELLEAEPASLDVAVVPTESPPAAVESVQAYVNRMLKRVAEPAGATPDLTSHSFRRGGAQHANGDDRLVTQWIFQPAWDMTKTNKAFAYITNTAREDRKVARVLSGWAADDVPAIIDVATLDHASQERLGRLQCFLFNSCTSLKQQRLNVSTKVLSVLTAYLIRYYPQLKELSPNAPIVTRVEECLRAADIPVGDMLAWSVALDNEAAPPAQGQTQTQDTSQHHCPSHEHLLAVIHELITSNKALAARLTIVEAALMKSKEPRGPAGEDQAKESLDQEPKPKRRKKQATHLSAAWYEWYTRVPRVWDCSDRQKKSESRHVVAFMKIFLEDGFTLVPTAGDYKDQVLDAGRRAEDAVLAFLKSQNINVKGAGSVLRALRPLHKSGVLDERIAAHKRLLAIGSITDPAPADTQDILNVVGHV
ncbi:Hypothetical protein PHPALM_7890 [Phytophthora palmivora]|uniref:Uncharacterized protein n=1 Tax=Phytophthora palmivora TaxID=4796 RepID=A0A2P4YB76_9STRA|nr:Hypothetical protein PHPALM_7890 [Phytophthora palmivora]